MKLRFSWSLFSVATAAIFALLGVLIYRAYLKEMETVVLSDSQRDELTRGQVKRNLKAERAIAIDIVRDSKSRDPPNGFPQNARLMSMDRARRIVLQARELETDQQYEQETPDNQTIIGLYETIHGKTLINDFNERSCSSEREQNERQQKKLKHTALKKAIHPLTILSVLTISDITSFTAFAVLIIMAFSSED